jgi:hypothetical protein
LEEVVAEELELELELAGGGAAAAPLVPPPGNPCHQAFAQALARIGINPELCKQLITKDLTQF